MIIAIDGPAASGKSTTAKRIAEQLNLLYIDTGAMYRAVALLVFEQCVEYDNLLALETLLDNMNIEIKTQNGANQFFLNGKNVTDKIRKQSITKLSSEIAKIKMVREKMVKMQRLLSQNHDVILDGRDIGTVVFPNADFKFFITASLDVRAARRFKELQEKGGNVDFEVIKQELAWRDTNDSQRAESPLCKAKDAIEIDTTHLTIEGQVKKIIKKIESKK